MMPSADYSLYLVTDSTPAILGPDKDLCQVVEAALRGGVTCVQYRDKKSDTAVLVETARRLHAITQRFHVPLLINDRIDVALAVGCEGVHIGQDDLGGFLSRPPLPLAVPHLPVPVWKGGRAEEAKKKSQPSKPV